MPEDKIKQLNPFEKLYKRKLSDDELAEIRHNLFGYMDLLLEMDREQKQDKQEGQND